MDDAIEIKRTALLAFIQTQHMSSYHLSLVTRKSVFGIFDQERLKPACAATEAS